MAGRGIEPRKTRSRESQRARPPRMATSLRPKDSDWDAAVSSGSESSASLHMPFARESGDLDGASPSMVGGRHPGEGDEPQALGVAIEESDEAIVPGKPANSRVTPEESVEGRAEANGKPRQDYTPGAQDRECVYAHLARVGRRAKEKPEERFINLLSFVKVPLLREAYQRLNEHAAAGVDGETWAEYGQNLEARLLDLQDRVQRGSYKPQPVRRVYIAKADGRKRPLGIPALEDKIVQQAVRMLMEPIYESMFREYSYGFRPGRSPHMALDALYTALGRKTNWVLDADIRSFFDTIDHGWMQRFIEYRIGDRRLVKLLMRWLKAGVMEDGKLHEVKEGTPQGGIISPLLANIYLHYVLDLWVQEWRRTPGRGEVYFVRYADDFVMGFQREEDAREMLAALADRLKEHGLELHRDKTQLIRFGRFARRDCVQDGLKRPKTFVFLGFTHICAEGRDGRFRLLRRTARKKREAKLASLRAQIQVRRHALVMVQYRWLSAVLRGHYGYYGVPGNFQAMASFRGQVRRAWHGALQRRSQRAGWTRERLENFEAHFPLPPARITHPHPLDRMAARFSFR